jgi:hypothetical protein
MPRIDIPDPARYELATTVAVPLGASAEAGSLSIIGSAPLAALLRRIAAADSAVLPVRRGDHDEWLVVGVTRRDLDAALAGVSRFIVPTYAEYEDAYPSLKTFDPDSNAQSRLAAAVYPAGYYVLRSPALYLNFIMERLSRWADLEAMRPTMQAAHSPSYRDLYDEFSAALSGAAWDTAEELLAELRRRGLTTAENLAFLEVQLLAQQRRWPDLFRREDYRDLAKLRSPRAVRGALLAAFHQSELLPLEQAGRWSDALDMFRRRRGLLGRLIEGPADLAYGPALRTFAYREAVAGDHAALGRLAQLAQDEETRLTVETIAGLVPPPVTPVASNVLEAPPLTVQHALRLALDDDDFDGAMVIAEGLGEHAERARAMVEVAFRSGEAVHAEAALLQLWALPQAEQNNLLQSRYLARMASALEEALTPDVPVEQPPTQHPIADWLCWLDAAVTDVDDRRLPRSLAFIATANDRYWSAERVGELAERLVKLAGEGAALSRPHLRDAIKRLRDQFLQDSEFPREDAAYADVYEALYTTTLEQWEVNEVTTFALTRLAEARLRRTPYARDSVTSHLLGWLAEPMVALEAAAQEVMEVLAAYGVQGPSLGPWYRSWAEALLAAPRQFDQLTLESWLLLGEWAQPGADLLDALRARLAAIGAREDDPVAALPAGYKIGIYTLSPDRVGRVAELLRRRNSNLEVIICDDKLLTERARNLAQSADIAVVVTGCVKHALTYGIGPYLRDPVYPASAGSTSILRAIEARLLKVASGATSY